jgi:hypothetical protein
MNQTDENMNEIYILRTLVYSRLVIDSILLIVHFRRDWADLNISYPAASVDWNAEKGYTSNMPKDVIPQRSYGTGLLYGLSLVLDVEIDEYYCSSTDSAGFKVRFALAIHFPYLVLTLFRQKFRERNFLSNHIFRKEYLQKRFKKTFNNLLSRTFSPS